MENGLRVRYSYDATNRVLEESYPNDKGENTVPSILMHMMKQAI
ncbi:RHS repeat domain-containing protein [[Eubacterium] hominis]